MICDYLIYLILKSSSNVCTSNRTGYESWKRDFDSDPLNRKRAGVKRYQVYRRVDDPAIVVIDLYFEKEDHAQTMLGALQDLWKKVEGTVMVKAQTKLLQVVESIDL